MANDRVSKALGERFSFTLANTSGATKIVAILAAFFDTLLITADDSATPVITKKWTDSAAIVAAGYACDAVIDDGTILTGVTAVSGNSEMTIRQFREYIKLSGKLLIDMAVQANNGAAFNQTIKVVKCTPLGGSAPQYLPLTDFKSVDQSATDKINVNNINLEMDFDTLMTMPIATGHEVVITFKFS